MRLRSRKLNVFSMSALDLFASDIGAFILIAVMALPDSIGTRIGPDCEPNHGRISLIQTSGRTMCGCLLYSTKYTTAMNSRFQFLQDVLTMMIPRILTKPTLSDIMRSCRIISIHEKPSESRTVVRRQSIKVPFHVLCDLPKILSQ